jgi:hypothetical protein
MRFMTFRKSRPTTPRSPAARAPLVCEEGNLLPRFSVRVAVFALLLLLPACRQKMADQPRYDPYDESSFFPDTLSARPLPAGTISRDFAPTPADRPPFAITLDVLHRGRERYDIFCSPCHGYTGHGDGIVARRGFRRPPASFHTDELRAAPPEHFFDVITNGFGSMPSYSYQVEPNDRWSIAAYIRALQLSQWSTTAAVPPAELQRLEATR